ncbi:MAG: hypothetical protein JWQ89_3556 [Devosia sp.]|uniref:hypothetical protein n=1 Tax=Devosia sp. TaxID=1871048 RepID=UPI00263484B2|nr:hypothetical protein [Devosia sp.]MDB5541829.1 hypothetical protein [Devosia sp.]
MRAILLMLWMFCLPAQAARAPSDQEAQDAHANGSCGSLGPGTGLSDNGKGWIVSMLPGPHEFRMVPGGSVEITVAKYQKLDFDAGRAYFIVIKGPVSRLQWKVPGRDWGSVSKLFLYPESRPTPPGAIK